MTTRTWTSSAFVSNNSNFRTVFSDLATYLAEAGLVKETVFGEIDFTTVSYPAAYNTFAGFQIWRFNDSLQATAPIFIKFEYGLGDDVGSPELRLTVGTGYSGSTITGVASTVATRNVTAGGQPSVNGDSYPSYLCVNEGFFGLLWKAWPNNTDANYTRKFFAICRTCDSTGAPTAIGAAFYAGYAGPSGSSIKWQCLKFSNAPAVYPSTMATLSTTACFCVVPGAVTDSTNEDGNRQAYMHWMTTPGVSPVFGMCTILLSEIGRGSTLSLPLVGSVPRTYLSLGWVGAAEVNGLSRYGMAMLWE
jgi:hypothetical protein